MEQQGTASLTRGDRGKMNRTLLIAASRKPANAAIAAAIFLT
jgi:hypothetical protein